MRFSKYHALGNDYLVIDPVEQPVAWTPSLVRLLCDRHCGVGADGLLLGPLPAADADFALRLFNPDGSEFEKSGNGLRIFARYLWDRGLVRNDPFTILTPGGVVQAQVHPAGHSVTVQMGQVSFDSTRIPVAGPPREVIDETMEVGGYTLRFSAATIGNPHCVIVCEAVSAEKAQQLGPLIENDLRFPQRTNVQFMQVLDRQHIRLEIWERGAGYTLSSGSSSCAAAAVAHRLGYCDAHVTVLMPGGAIAITIAPDWSVTMRGAVTRICDGLIDRAIYDPSVA